MSQSLNLEQDTESLISTLSWVILVGYLLLGLLTFVLIAQFDFARTLFDSTELIILINAVWFSLGIVGYGIFSLIRNYRRANLSNLAINLDTQFLIVIAFLFLSLKQILDLFLFLIVEPTATQVQALENTAKVFEFGAFVAGLASIYIARKR